MDIRHLKAFVAVAESLNFRQASVTLNIAQPAISKTIAELERNLGLQLFDRSRHHVALTMCGRELLPEAHRILASTQHFTDKARLLSSGEAGRIRIGFLASPLANTLPLAIQDFRKETPDVIIDADEIAPERQVADLLEDRIDLALTRPIPDKHRDQIEQELLNEDRLVLALPANHPLAQEATVALSDCRTEPYIQFYRSGSELLFDAATTMAQEAGFTLQVAQEVKQMSTALTLTAAGNGVSLVPSCVKALANPQVTFRDVTPASPPIPLVAAWAKERTNQATLNLLWHIKRHLHRSR